MNPFFKFIIASAILAPSISFASFSLASMKSINCNDAAKTATKEIFSTTEDSPAHTYTRRVDTIPFDYGNKKSPFQDAQTGQMKLVNNPEQNGGVIDFADLTNPGRPNRLLLTPKGQTGTYFGILTGAIETEKGWDMTSIYQILCVVR